MTHRLQNKFVLSVLSAAIFCSLPGCKTLSHPEAKQEAEARWSGVRSQVKLQLAEQHFARQRFSDALPIAIEAVTLDPKDAQAYALAAKCHLELGQAASAENLLDAAAKANVSTAELTYLRGVVLELREDLPSAISAYTQARQGDNKQVDFLLAEAECLAATGQSKAALELLASHAHAYNERGDIALLAARIAELNQDVAAAIGWYRQATTFLPDNEAVAEGLGVLLAGRGECAEAVHLLRPLLDKPSAETDRGGVRRGLSSCYLLLDDAVSAEAVLAEYANRATSDAAAQLLLAEASIAANDLITAAEAVHRLEQQAPRARDTLLMRAILDWKRGRLADATSRLEALIEAYPSDMAAASLLGELQVALE